MFAQYNWALRSSQGYWEQLTQRSLRLFQSLPGGACDIVQRHGEPPESKHLPQMESTRPFYRGVFVGVLIAGFGLWLLWRGIRNDVWRSSVFNEPMLNRWYYILGGTLCIAGGIGYVVLLFWLTRA